MYCAIVLAGGMGKKFNSGGATVNEALLDIGGLPMITRVLAALRQSRSIRRIIVVGAVENLRQSCAADGVDLVRGGASLIDSVAEGVKAAATMEKVLLCTADVPFLTGEAVDDFIRQCDAENADLYYPVIEKSVMDKRFSKAKRTYVKLRDGVFTGGNLFLVNPVIIPRCMYLAYKIIDHRKNPLKLASMLGWGHLLKFVVGVLSSEGAKKRAAEILQVNICVINSAYAEIGMDIDKNEDLEAAKNYFGA